MPLPSFSVAEDSTLLPGAVWLWLPIDPFGDELLILWDQGRIEIAPLGHYFDLYDPPGRTELQPRPPDPARPDARSPLDREPPGKCLTTRPAPMARCGGDQPDTCPLPVKRPAITKETAA